MCEIDYAFDELLSRVRRRYLQTPGLSLTVRDTALAWRLDPVVCEAILGCLVASGFLRVTASGTYALAVADGAVGRVPPRPTVISTGFVGGDHGHAHVAR
jgi:hypothetical protein